jgi:hypothetical protein
MEKMDRGDGGCCTDTCRAHLGNTTKCNVRQTRRGWWQELIGCDAKSEFSYFNAVGTKVATSLEESGWFCRVCCTYVLLLSRCCLGFLPRRLLLLLLLRATMRQTTPCRSRRLVYNHTCGHTSDVERLYTSNVSLTRTAGSSPVDARIKTTTTRAIHPFTMRIKEVGTEAELLTIERPCACGVGPCKCGCYQSAKFRSGGVSLGSIEEDCYYCVYSFQIKDGNDKPVYKLHPPTCWGGICADLCTEGNPCTRDELLQSPLLGV